MVCRLLSLSATLVVLAATSLGAEPIASIPNPRVKDGTWVTDTAGALSPDTIARLNQKIGEIHTSHGIEMAVVVIRSLDGLSIEETAERIFNRWGIGKKGKDNGILFLWATGDRKVRIEVGYGLEGVIPDGKAGAILDTYVIPRFRASEFERGVLAGVDATLAAARSEDIALPAIGTESYDSDGSWLSWWPYFGSVPVGIGLLTAYRKWRRYRRRKCPQCQTKMALVPDYEDDALLAAGQVKEEHIGSVEYDVWKCPACSHHFTLRYAKWATKYDKCPQCSNRTKSSTESVTSAPTTSSSGTALVMEKCAFCSFTNEFTKTLPRITQSSSSSGSSGGGSSFGGGRSGGGGASRGY
jgi:uncharacterized protein